MKTVSRAALAAALAVTFPPRTTAETLTLDAALARARERSVAILAARGRVSEAEARLRSRPGVRDNPTLEAAHGSRNGSDRTDFEIGLRQSFELGGRGGARRQGDQAAFARERAGEQASERAVLREVRIAFVRGLHAAERRRLAAAQESDASTLLGAAERRHAAGDVAALDVNVAASARARARAEAIAAQATEASALGELRAFLDLPAEEPLALEGSLEPAPALDATRWAAAIDQRPELRALEAEVGEAEAEAKLGRGLAWPEIAPELRYERDQGDRVLWAGLSISLPLLDRGQQLRATGRVRAERLRTEIAGTRRALATRLQTLLAVHALRGAAVQELRANSDRLADNESLARRSYEVGQIGLAELLLVRRETHDARREWLDSLLELAQVRAELDALGGKE